jgi:hypothetical protein
MARPVTTQTARLKSLGAARDRAKKLKRGAVVDAATFADLIGLRWSTVREWFDRIDGFEESGCFVRGGNGVEWQIKALKAIDFIIAHYRAEEDRRREKNQKLRQKTGVTLPEAEAGATFEETRGLVKLTIDVVAAKEKQGEYTPTGEMIVFIDGLYQTIVNGILGTRTKVDPNGNLPAHVRAKIDDHLRALATGVHQDVTRFIEKHRARLQQGGAGQAG